MSDRYRFLLLHYNGDDTTVTQTYGDEQVAHFDDQDAALKYARRRAAEDAASVLVRTFEKSFRSVWRSFWVDITDVKEQTIRGLTVAAPR